MSKDITKQYLQEANPGLGNLTIEEGVDRVRCREEIKIAEWIKENFGGDIIVRQESGLDGVKVSDYIWREKCWEHKAISSDKYGTIDKRMHKAINQILENPGGMILDFTNSKLDLKQSIAVVEKAAFKRVKNEFDVIVKKQNSFKVIKISKD